MRGETRCELCGSNGSAFVARGGNWICIDCEDRLIREEEEKTQAVSGADEENAQLRARCQAAESTLRQLLTAAEDALLVAPRGQPETRRLEEVVKAVKAGLPESPLRICTRCHRPLVVPQVLDHIETPTGWVCMPCVDSEPRQRADASRRAF